MIMYFVQKLVVFFSEVLPDLSREAGFVRQPIHHGVLNLVPSRAVLFFLRFVVFGPPYGDVYCSTLQQVVQNIHSVAGFIEDFLCPAELGLTQLTLTFQFGVSILTQARVLAEFSCKNQPMAAVAPAIKIGVRGRGMMQSPEWRRNPTIGSF